MPRACWQRPLAESLPYRCLLSCSCSDLPWELFFLQNERDPRGRHEFILKTSHAIFDGTAFTFFGPLLVRTCARLLLSDKDGVVEAEPAFAPHGSQEDSYKRACVRHLALTAQIVNL